MGSRMPTLVEKLQLDAMDPKVSVTDLLRRVKFTAVQLGLGKVEDWVEQELNGYDGPTTPEYHTRLELRPGCSNQRNCPYPRQSPQPCPRLGAQLAEGEHYGIGSQLQRSRERKGSGCLDNNKHRFYRQLLRQYLPRQCVWPQ